MLHSGLQGDSKCAQMKLDINMFNNDHIKYPNVLHERSSLPKVHVVDE